MEIFVYHPGLQKWLEMLRPMGLPEDVKVINRYVVIQFSLPFLTPAFLHLLLSQQETCHPM